MRIGYALCMMFLMIVSKLLISIPSEALDYGMDQYLGNVEASFWGEKEGDQSGYSVAVVGDVNGDGFNDILIGANGNEDGGYWAGQTYLILGKASGWAMDTDLSASDASFWGETSGDESGYSVAGAGDVNGDGYDDILIGAYSNEDGGSEAGQTYLIFGKASGWAMDTDLSVSDASFWGENAGDYSGWSIAGVGDVNGDGYDDILIGATGNDDGGDRAGQTYLIFGKASGWAMDTDLSVSDASFWGEDEGDWSGCSVADAGDVNGDGYDDILIGAPFNEDGGKEAGQTYLILGKASGWAMDTDLSASDASFWGEDVNDTSGGSVAGAGDVNGDGFDDILIGATGNDDGGDRAGQTYLILGKASGWTLDADLSASDASFWGEDRYDISGSSVAGAGDVNGDGYYDILIGAPADEVGGDAGQTYLILGKASNWTMDDDLSASDASFWGEEYGCWSGTSVAGAGDVNGDGYYDILIGADGDGDGGDYAGQTYLIFPDHNSRPTSITSIKAYSDDEYIHEITSTEPIDKIYLELHGIDGGAQKNIAQVWVKGNSNPNKRFILRLNETGENTGKFRGEITIATRTHERYHWIDVSLGGWVEISSRKDPTILINISNGPGIHIAPRPNNVYINEDENFLLHFNTTGVNPELWTFETNAPWLFWDEFNMNLFGTPTNIHVGAYWVNLQVEGNIYSDEIKFTIIVNNTPPAIFFPKKTYVYEDEELFLDINSTDEGEGIITWNLESDADWLNQNTTSGVLYGNPTNRDVGAYNINVSMDDGKGGIDFLNFFFDVLNTPPVITTQNIEEISQDEEYFNNYHSTDDGQGSISWSLTTNATWLSINSKTGLIYETPTNDEVGIYTVNISVSDGNDGWDYTEFPLHVLNVNDPPILYDGNATLSNGDTSTNLTFSVMYKDIDGDEPVVISAFIDNDLYDMIAEDPISFDLKKGVQYYLTLNMTEGVHQYYYSVSDGEYTVRFPENGYLTITTDSSEKDSDSDGYIDTYEIIMGSDPFNESSTPFDWDGDGWDNSVEIQVGKDPMDKLSVPRDLDEDGIPNSLDPDKDGDGVPNANDAFPYDGDQWEREKKVEEVDGWVWWIMGVEVVVLVFIVIMVVVLITRGKKGEDEVKSEGCAIDEPGIVEKKWDGGREEIHGGMIQQESTGVKAGSEIVNTRPVTRVSTLNSDQSKTDRASEEQVESLETPICPTCAKASQYYPEYDCYWCIKCQIYVYAETKPGTETDMTTF